MTYRTLCQLGDPDRRGRPRSGCLRCLGRAVCLSVALTLDEPPAGI